MFCEETATYLFSLSIQVANKYNEISHLLLFNPRSDNDNTDNNDNDKFPCLPRCTQIRVIHKGAFKKS